MKTTLRISKEVDAVTLHVEAGARYWEDATVNGVEDESGDLIPFRKGDCWCPVIDIDSGKIIDWPKGITANIHYKVCDNGVYTLKDEQGETITKIDGYVPACLCPSEDGYGDYIIMDINEDGVIADWQPDLSAFEVA